MFDWVSGKTVNKQNYAANPLISSLFVLTSNNKNF